MLDLLVDDQYTPCVCTSKVTKQYTNITTQCKYYISIH